ncbi:unnamed protein product [Arabidopsis halleri]
MVLIGNRCLSISANNGVGPGVRPISCIILEDGPSTLSDVWLAVQGPRNLHMGMAIKK